MKEDTSEQGDPQKLYEDLSTDDFKKSYGEDLANTIDIETWKIDRNLAKLYSKIEQELLDAKRNEIKANKVFRDEVFPRIKENITLPEAGLHADTTLELIEKIHKGFLFNGAVTACGGVSTMYDSLPISITQMGVCLVNYQGQHGSYSHQLFRRDLRFTHADPVKDAKELIERRRSDDKTKLHNLAMSAIKAYAERAILLEKSDSKWLMGIGSPVPNEFMMGFWANREEMKEKSVDLMKRMILEHQRFVYVQASTRYPELWAFGNALEPFEYLVIDTLEEKLAQLVTSGNTRLEIKNAYQEIARSVGSKIAVGVYKVSRFSPPHIFYCHINHIRTAALIAMSDSALQMHSGNPMLLDLAENLCKNAFGKNDFMASIDQAYTRADVLTKINT